MRFYICMKDRKGFIVSFVLFCLIFWRLSESLEYVPVSLQKIEYSGAGCSCSTFHDIFSTTHCNALQHAAPHATQCATQCTTLYNTEYSSFVMGENRIFWFRMLFLSIPSYNCYKALQLNVERCNTLDTLLQCTKL